VVIVSTELAAVFALADRIGVMYQGKFVDILDPVVATPQQLGLLMGGSRPVSIAEAAAAGELTHVVASDG
jgi:simple sugar transport system ATP-binding protein